MTGQYSQGHGRLNKVRNLGKRFGTNSWSSSFNTFNSCLQKRKCSELKAASTFFSSNTFMPSIPSTSIPSFHLFLPCHSRWKAASTSSSWSLGSGRLGDPVQLSMFEAKPSNQWKALNPTSNKKTHIYILYNYIYTYYIHIFNHFTMSNHIFQLYFPTRCSNHFLTISTGGQMTPPWHCAWQIPCWSVKAVLENDAPWGKGKSSMVLKILVTLDVCITV